MRVLKAKKELKYGDIVVETIKMVKAHFIPDPDSIKKRVESLVEQEYLERKPDTKNVFLYVA